MHIRDDCSLAVFGLRLRRGKERGFSGRWFLSERKEIQKERSNESLGGWTDRATGRTRIGQAQRQLRGRTISAVAMPVPVVLSICLICRLINRGGVADGEEWLPIK